MPRVRSRATPKSDYVGATNIYKQQAVPTKPNLVTPLSERIHCKIICNEYAALYLFFFMRECCCIYTINKQVLIKILPYFHAEPSASRLKIICNERTLCAKRSRFERDRTSDLRFECNCTSTTTTISCGIRSEAFLQGICERYTCGRNH